MLRTLLLGISIGGIIFTNKGKKLVNEQINNIKKYMIDGITNTEILQVGKEFLKGYNNEDVVKTENDDESDIKLDSKNSKKEQSNKKY